MIYGLFIDDSLCLDIFITLHGLSKMSLISLIAFNTSRNHICVYRAICCNYIFYVLYFIYITKVRSNYIDFHLAYNHLPFIQWDANPKFSLIQIGFLEFAILTRLLNSFPCQLWFETLMPWILWSLQSCNEKNITTPRLNTQV